MFLGDNTKQILYLKYLVLPIIAGVFVLLVGGFWGKLWWDDFDKPLIEIKATSISNFDLEPDFFESLKNYPVKITIQNIGRKTAEGVSVCLEFDQEILNIAKIKTSIEPNSWKIKSANKQLDVVVDGEYFTTGNIDKQISKNTVLDFEKIRAGEHFQFIVFTKQPAVIEKCEFFLENSENGSCVLGKEGNKLSGMKKNEELELITIVALLGLSLGIFMFGIRLTREKYEMAIQRMGEVERVSDKMIDKICEMDNKIAKGEAYNKIIEREVMGYKNKS